MQLLSGCIVFAMHLVPGKIGVNKPSFNDMRTAMIDSQLRTTGVNDMEVIGAIAAVPRERFVPKERELLAYLDEDQPIAPGRWIMEPMIFGRLLVAARFARHERVLIVGAGTGYSTAVIARLAGAVVAVEEDMALAAKARGNLDMLDVLNATVVEAPLPEGAPKHGPFDVLFFDGAVERIPEALLAQLRDGGRVIAVLIDEAGVGRGVNGVVAAGSFGTTAFLDAMLPVLPGFERPKMFKF